MFTAQELLRLVEARPFIPFRLVTSDGGNVPILSPEVIMVGKRFALVGLLDPDARDTLFDRWVAVWYMHVTRAEMLDSGPPPFSAPPDSSQSTSPAPA